jgi:hypothetical protein
MDEIYNELLQIPNVIVIIRLYCTYDLHISVAIEDFNKIFEISERSSKINGLEKPNVFLTLLLPAWPLNLFPAMLEEEGMPKYGLGKIGQKQPNT